MVYIDKSNYRIAISYEDPDYNNSPNDDREESGTASSAGIQEQVVMNTRPSKLLMEDIGHKSVVGNTTSAVSHDDDESIDQNAVNEKYKDEINGKVR